MSKPEVFHVTDHHLKLLKRMYVGWDDTEFGAPSIDPKRPYGNSDVINDICEILKLERTYSNEKYADDIHREMETALQILVCNLSIEVGTYEHPNWHDWKKVGAT